MDKNKNSVIIAAAAVILLSAGAYYWYSNIETAAPPPAPINTADEAVGAVTSGGDISTASNPVNNKVPEVNPVDQANPFKDTYKNPFE